MTAIDKFAKLLDIYTNVPFAHRNLLAGGNKDFWNATTQPLTALSAYTCEVLQLAQCGAGGAGTYTLETFAAGAATTYGLGRPAQYYGQTAITTASTGTLAALTTPGISRWIESVSQAEGCPLTLSVWLWVASGTLNVTQAHITQNFGTGGAPSANVTTLVPINWTLTTTPQRFSILLNVPSIVGKTIGTTTTGFTTLGIDFPPGAVYAVNDAQWQAEYCSPQASNSITGAGGEPTAFEYRGPQPELARIQRYYEEVYDAVGIAACNATTGFLGVNVPFQTAKRASAAFSYYAPAGVTMQPGGQTITSLAAMASTVSGFVLSGTSTSLTVGLAYSLNGVSYVIADARF